MRADHCQPERKPLALETNANNNSNNSFNKHSLPTNQLIASSLNNPTGQSNLKQQQSPFSSFSSRDLANVNQSPGVKNKNTTAESVLLSAFKQQHLINSSNKKQQEVLAAVFIDPNNNRITNVNNVTNSSTSLSNAAAAALNLTPIDQSLKNSNLSNSNIHHNNSQTTKFTSSNAADLSTIANVVTNLFALNNQQIHDSDSNNNTITCKNQNDLLSTGVGKQKVVEFLENNNSELHSPLTSAGILAAAAANFSDLNSVLLQRQDCNNNNSKLLNNNDSLSNQSNNSSLGTKAAFDMMAKIVKSGNSNGNGSSSDNECKNLMQKIDVDACSKTMDDLENLNQIEDYDLDLIIDEEQINFNLTPPSNNNNANFPNLQYICEYSTRLFFLNVQWAQSITVFKKLIDQTQIQLLRSCWCDLFILGKIKNKLRYQYLILI